MDTESEFSLWYYAQDGQAIGPLPLSSIRALKHAGQLTQDSMIAREGTEDWQPLSAVLVDHASQPTPEKIAAPELPQKPERWHDRPFMVIVLLLFLYPVGLAVLWTTKHFSRPIQWALTLATGMIFAATILEMEKREDQRESVSEAARPRRTASRTSHPIPAQSKTETTDPIEYKLACIDAGYAISRDTPELAEYRRVLVELARRFEVTPDDIGDMTNAVTKHLREKEKIKTSSLEMMQAAEMATSGDNAKMLGVGKNGFSSTMATLAIFMIDAAEKKTAQ